MNRTLNARLARLEARYTRSDLGSYPDDVINAAVALLRQEVADDGEDASPLSRLPCDPISAFSPETIASANQLIEEMERA